MKHYTPSFPRRNTRAFFASLLAYLLLVGQLTPLALASNNRATRVAPSRTTEIARDREGGAPSVSAAAAPVPLAVSAALVPTITATKTDSFPDPDMDGKAEPGDTITYTITITNNGTAATNVTLTDTVDPNTTIVAGSAVATPIATDESYNVLGNVRIQPNAAGGLLANDNNPNTGNNTGLTASGPTSSTQGGNVTVSADGSFTYNPPAGFTGSDSFTYTITSANGSDTATATFNVGNGTGTAAGANDPVIWFVQAGAASGGDGRLTSPFNCLVGTGCFDPVAADQAGDTIFVYEGTYNDTGVLTLLNTQKLVGQGATDTLVTITGVTVPPHSDALPPTKEDNNALNAPTINSTANGVTLGQNNVLRGFNVGNVPAASIKINGAGFGQLTIGKTTEPDVSTSGTGRALFLQNGTLAATSGVSTLATTSSSGAAAVLLTQITAGALTAVSTSVAGAAAGGVEVNGSSADISFGNTDVAAGTDGVSLANNPAGTRSFGTLSITGGTGIGFRHFDPDGAGAGVGGGAVNVTGAMTVTNPGGNGIDVDSSNANLSFAATTVNKGSTSNIGVDLTNNVSRTIAFTSLTVTTTNGFALNTNNSGTVTAGGGSLTQSGAGGGAASLTNTTLGLSFTSVSSTSGGNGLLFTGGSGTFTSGTTNLQSNAGVGLSMSSSAVAANFGNTTVNSSAGDAVDLSGQTGNVTFGSLNLSPDANLRGLDASGNTGTITATSGNIATTNAAAINIDGPAGRTPLALALTNVDVTGGAGPDNGVNLTDVSGSFSVSDATATTISNTTGTGIVVNNSTATVNFGNTSVTGTGNANGDDIGTGILLTNNAGAVTFGTLTLTPDSGERGLFATDSDATAAGAITVASGTITTTNDTAVEITGQADGNRTPLNIQLTTVNTTGGTANGITLINTNGTFTVNGNGTNTAQGGDGSGGTISGKSGANGSTTTGSGVYLSNVTGVTLRRMVINGTNQNYGVFGSNVTGFILQYSEVSGTNGNTDLGEALDEGSIRFNNLQTNVTFPTAQIDNCEISGGFKFNLFVINSTAGTTLDRLMVTNNAFGLIGATAGNDNVDIIARPNPASGVLTVKSTVQDNTFAGTRASFVQAFADGNSVVDTKILENKFNEGQATIPGGGISVGIRGDSAGTASTHTYEVSCNRLGSGVATANGYDTVAMFIAKGNGNGTFSGNITNNVIGPPEIGAVNAAGLNVRTAGNGTHTYLIQNNSITGYTNSGIYLNNQDGDATVNASLFSNVTIGAGFAFAGVFVDSGAISTDNVVMNLVLGSFSNAGQKNDFSLGDPANGSDVLLVKNASSTLNLSRNGSAAGTVEQVVKDDNLNPALTTVSPSGTIILVNTLPATPAAAPTACSIPSAPETFDTDEITGPGGVPTATTVEAAVAQPAATNNNVTSRPFISPVRTAPTQAARPAPQRAAAVATAPATTTTSAIQQPAQAAETDTPTVNPPVVNGDTLTWNVGTLPAGASVTITFQVTVDNPYNGPANVSNQGTITCTECGGSILTDDPAVAGTNNPTLTPIDSINIFARDAKVAEPVSPNTVDMTFTVALSAPATGPVSVNFTTADGTATAGTCGQPGADYVTTSGTVNFATGDQVKAINVPICSDSDTDDNETLLLNLTGATGGTILDNQATGTITANTPGTFLISELRTFGPGSGNDPNDEFVEVYNNSNSPLTVAASDASAGYGLFAMGANCDATPVLLGVIPNGTVIPARGHYLFTGSAYSLANYGGTGAAAGNLTMSADIPTNGNVAIFTTSDLVNLSSVARLDAVGFGTNVGSVCNLLREGSTIPAATTNLTSLGQHSYLRDLCGKGGSTTTLGTCPTQGFPKDGNDNATDFFFVDTNATNAGAGQRLGAPGPENIASPIKRDASFTAAAIDASVSTSVPPNRARDINDTGTNKSFGTMSIRRRYTNNTGGPVTRLRFRIIDVSTFGPQPSGSADLRAMTSLDIVVSNVNDPATCLASTGSATTPCTVTIRGTTLEQPPTQTNGGGINATLSAGTVTLGTPLANGASINVQYLLGVEQTGAFKFLIIIEALP